MSCDPKSSADQPSQNPLPPYSAPKVTELGSVKAMTQGSGGAQPGDAGLMMA